MKGLYKHQQDIVDSDPTKTGLFLGTGSGKTRIALMLARGRTLVICPKTQKEDGNWERELESIVKDFWSTHGVFDLLKCPLGQVTVISKETFRRDHASLPAFDTVIVDEAHTCLGVTPNTRQRKRVVVPKTSQLYEALESFLARTKPERIYLLSATILRSPMTVWGAGVILEKMDRTIEGFYSFRQKFYTKLPIPGRDIWVPKSDSKSKDDLAYYVRSMGYVGRLEDYVDMPEQSFKTEYVELTEEQKKRIKEIPMEYPEPLTRSLKTHMIENGVLNGDEFSSVETFKNQKLDRILEYSIEFPRIVVFARYLAQIDQLARALTKEGKKVFVLTGGTKDRGTLLQQAKESQNYVFICQSNISSGWELSDCPVVIFASLDFSIVNLIQAQGRISRINNPKRNLYIYLVVKKSVDEHVYKTVVETKMDFHLAQYAQ